MNIDKAWIKQVIIKALRFFQSSLAAFITNLGVLTFCTEILGILPSISFLLAIFSATTVSYLVCRYFVFKHCERENIFKQYWKFLSSAMMFRAVEFCLFSLFVDILGYYYLYVFFIVQTTSMLFKYFVFSKYVFKDKGVQEKLNP